MKGDIYIISAPSGTGKTTIIKRLMKNKLPRLHFSISYTTRKPREKEKDGRDYFFVSAEEFNELIRKDAFMEYANVHQNLYGTPKEQVLPFLEKGFDVLLDIDVQGGLKIKEKCPDSVLIFMIPPSMLELERRLSKRKFNSEAEKKLRLENVKKELQYWEFYDYIVINRLINEAVDCIKSIIIANRCKRAKNLAINNLIKLCEEVKEYEEIT